jgi:assimilatory nitrate reductase electron transfer subunit
MTREQVVVVGAGMVGHRFVDELVRRDGAGRFDIHLVGAEDYAPYNRILLSDVLAGRCDLAALTLPEPDDRVAFERGTRAVGIDRDAGTVALSHGGTVRFDHLVLATGARAFVPPLPGLADGLPRHAHVLRTLDDCRDLAARAINAQHAVVLGGGVLGLEAACGLVRRGVRVTLVHVAGHLAQTQLDATPAAVLAATLGDLGVDVRTSASLDEVLTEDGALHSVRLDDGLTLPTDLLLVSTGVRPRTELARAAGLSVRAGVVVGADLRSPDDARVSAIGDCAEPPEGGTGLVGPGWEQATRLAARLTGTPAPTPAAAGSPPVRLKAAGVDLVTMGTRASEADPCRDRVVTVSDPVGRRHLEVTVRAGRLTGVTCVGAPELGASLSVAYDRGTPLPSDPLALLLPERAEEDGSAALMPAGTPVCRCNGVAKRDIVEAWEQGARTVPEVATSTRATTGCGGCRSVVCGLVDWLRASDPDTTSQPGTSPGEKTVSGAQHDPARDEISAP